MKNLNLIKRLWTDSHEKQKVRGMQKYCILLLLLFTCVTHAWAATRRLYYDNSTTKWASVSCYCWKNGGANDQNWPGKSMTQIAGTNIWYRDVTNDNCDRCIFNNSNIGKQTSNQTIPSDQNKCTYDGNSTVSWSTYQVSSSASLSATSTSIGIGATSTLTPSLSSNSSHNEIKSTSYSVTTNPGSAGSVTSAGVFSATASGTYTVTATVTYNAKGFSGITSTTTATKQITVYDYIYFYAAIPNGWDNRTTTVRLTSSGSSALTPYDNTSLASTTKNASSPCVSVYSAVSSTSYYNNGAKYNVYIYKVLESDAGKNVYLGHSSWTFGTAIGTVAAGKLYTLTSGDNGGTYMTANAISVNSVTASGPYAINAVSLTSSISAYGTSTANLRTAGGDTFTTTYTLNDVTASTSTVITPSVSNTYTSNTGNLAGSISIDASDLIAGHTYTLTVKVADNITGKMTSSATSSSFAVTAASTATLTYHANWYTEETSGDVPAAQVVAKDRTAIVAGRNTLAMTNYTFSGWNTEEYITGTSYAVGSSITMDEDKDLYAVWTRSITLNQNGATKNGTTSVTGTYNCSTLPSITNPQKTGYTFVGWRTENNGTGNLVINTSGELQPKVYHWTDETTPSNRFQRNPSSTSPLYATWTQSVSLNANTGNHGSGTDKTGTATWNGASITIPTHCSAATGYSLDGYYTAATGGTKIIKSDKSFAGSDITVNSVPYISSSKWVHPGATTLYAQYTAKQYTITFDKQSGSSGTGSATVHFNNNDFSVSPVVAPTRTGYTFGGYFTNTNGGGVEIVNASGVWQSNKASYLDENGKWIYANNKTVYAKWTEKKVSISPTVNATGYAQGYTASATVGSIGIATTTVLTADAPGEGYRFSGWTLSSNLVITSGSVTDRSITVRTNGDGEAVSARADYEIDTYVRIYFRNTESWSGTIYAYVWYDGHAGEEGGKNAAWPGVTTSTETICGITYNYYEFNREDHPNWDKIIFNNNDSKQTSDLDVAGHNRLFYKFSDSKWYVPTNTFYFVNTEFWDDVKLYHFGGTNGEYLGSWPGRAMDKIGTVTIDGHEYDYYGIADGICSNLDGSYIINNGKDDSSKKQTSDISSISNYLGSFFVANKCFGASSSPSASDKPSGSWYDAEGVHSATIGCPALLPFADISSISLSGTRVPPMAEITATPNMNHKRAVDQAYCWGVYSDEECTSPVNVSFTSLGSGRVQFTVPQTMGTYYLKLTVRASAACNASIDDEEVQSFNVTTDNMVFFNKTDIPWSRVFVYFLGDSPYWDNDLGSGCNGRDYGKANEMHRIGKSEIYYYEYSGNSLGSNAVQYIAFTDNDKPYSGNFSGCQAAYRGDFARACAPMYVPENWITDYKNTSAGDGQAAYYNRGYWTTYGVSGVARNAGFTLKVFDKFDDGSAVASVDLTNTDGSNTYRATVNLTEVNYSYAYQLLSCGNKYYGNDGVMNANNSTNWKFETDKHRCGLNSQASGNYDFIVQCTDGGEVRVSVEFPLMNGDYRLIYNDTCVYQTGWHPSQFIRHNYSDGAKLDTVSMYIRPNKQPTLKIQVCDNASSTPPTWRDSITYDVSGLTYGHGVYNFYLSQEDGKLKINDVRPYTGLYYIRTQQADGGWTGYKTNSDNVMTYTEYAEQKNYGFNYYKAKWIGTTGADVTFTIACDYSESLCDTMVADPGNNPLTAAEARSLPHTASVRFGWNSLTNTLHRAYINGTSIVSDRYLVMIGDEKLKDSEGEPLAISGLNPNEIGFTDLNNWIYRCDVKAVTGAEVQLVGNYDGHTQHFIGTAEKPEEIIGGSSGEEYLMRVTYDFKTNRLMTAWLPDGDAITSNMTLNADMMLIREGQNAATQVYFGESAKDKKIDEIHSIYGVMEFQYCKFANQFPNWSAPHAYEYLMYYISFPFDVKVSEIFGCGVRGKNWIIQKYNGAKRAKIGWFAETSTFWETLPGDSTLHAHEGYLLLLDRISFNDPGSNVWTNRPEKVYLYFPSISNTIGTISDKDKSIEVPSHVCGINRSFTVDGVVGELNHRNTDSHWNVIGTPLFETKNAASIAEPEADGDGEKTLQYYYAWNCADNTLAPEATFNNKVTFKSMHGYMVQYAGTVTFHGASIEDVPASVAARHMPSDEKNYRIELQLINENGKTNRTYVELRENACDTFALNEDMYMMRSSRTVDLYSFAGAYDVAANVLSVNNHIVPVGTDVKVAGTYRFTMPSDFSGTVTLIDTETGTRTNLSFGDYEVNLPKGTSNTRFLLEININKMPTAIDGVDGGSLKDGKAHKFIQNGQMYILQNGIIYDAQGKRVK